jgi:hypothetical protein
MARSLKKNWLDTLAYVRDSTADVDRFQNLLTSSGRNMILAEKEHTRSLPPATVRYLGFDGLNQAEFKYINPYSGELKIIPAVDFDDFNQMLAIIEEKVQDDRLSHCKYNTATTTAPGIIKAWRIEAVEWAVYKARCFWNIVREVSAFSGLDDDIKPKGRFFKTRADVPWSFAQAFPNIIKQTQVTQVETVDPKPKTETITPDP